MENIDGTIIEDPKLFLNDPILLQNVSLKLYDQI